MVGRLLGDERVENADGGDDGRGRSAVGRERRGHLEPRRGRTRNEHGRDLRPAAALSLRKVAVMAWAHKDARRTVTSGALGHIDEIPAGLFPATLPGTGETFDR